MTTIKENSPRGSSIWVTPINPPSGSLFQPVIEARSPPNISNIGIFLEGLLDFETQNLYVLNITVSTYNGSELQYTSSVLTVQVLDVNEAPRCGERFTSIGETVQVTEDTTPLSAMFYVIATDPDSGSLLNFKIAWVVPSVASGRFSISSGGAILVPENGFNYDAGDRNFIFTIVVSDQFGENCTGSLTVSVLPSQKHQLNFTIQSQTVTTIENLGDSVYVANVSAAGAKVRYQFIFPSPYFSINEVTGIIVTKINLDLEADPLIKSTSLLILAFDLTTHLSATATVNIIVSDVNDNDPVCIPADFITTVPETVPVGTVFFALSCIDRDVSSTDISYKMAFGPNTPLIFEMIGSNFQVNDSLNYDSTTMSLMKFQYSVDIVVKDGGIPPRSVTVPVRITVSPVNEFSPEFQKPFSFFVLENSASGVLVGTVVATDQDWPLNSIQYSIVGGNNQKLFYIDSSSGNLYGRTPLDREISSSYSLQIQAVDQNQDVNPANSKTSTKMFTVNVEDVNDNPPVCNPAYYEQTIYSTLGNNVPVTTVMCTDVDATANLQYSITNGNVNNRFFMNGNQVRSRNLFSFDPFALLDPTSFDLQIEVTDFRFTRMVLVRVHVVPWTTTAPTTKRVSQPHLPVVVTAIERSWDPEPWFVAAITVTAVLLTTVAGIMVWKILSKFRMLTFVKAEPMSDPLLSSRSNNLPTSPRSSEPLKIENFDGRAKDPVSGRDYLFNSSSGERRWV
ncbi:cadherin-related family member 4-like isoform X2 [Lissotriton helveticus]